jgi:hypothetical protein
MYFCSIGRELKDNVRGVWTMAKLFFLVSTLDWPAMGTCSVVVGMAPAGYGCGWNHPIPVLISLDFTHHPYPYPPTGTKFSVVVLYSRSVLAAKSRGSINLALFFIMSFFYRNGVSRPLHRKDAHNLFISIKQLQEPYKITHRST